MGVPEMRMTDMEEVSEFKKQDDVIVPLIKGISVHGNVLRIERSVALNLAANIIVQTDLQDKVQNG